MKIQGVKLFFNIVWLSHKRGVFMNGQERVESISHFEGASDLVQIDHLERGRHHSFTAFVIKEIRIQVRAEVRQVGGDLKKIKHLASYCFHLFKRDERPVTNTAVADLSYKMDIDTLHRAIVRLFAVLNKIPIENFMKKDSDSLLIPLRATPSISVRNEFIKTIYANPGGFVIPVKPDRSDATMISSTIKKLLHDNPIIDPEHLNAFIEIGEAGADVSEKIESFMDSIDHRKRTIFELMIDHCLLLEAHNFEDPGVSSTKMTMENLSRLFSPTLALLNTADEFLSVNRAFVNLLKDKKREYAV